MWDRMRYGFELLCVQANLLSAFPFSRTQHDSMVDLQARRGVASLHHDDHRIKLLIKGFSILSISCIFGIIIIVYLLSPNNILHNRNSDKDDVGIRGEKSIFIKTQDDTQKQPIATIAYVITVSGCPKNDGSNGDFGAGIKDGAAVLQHSIHLNSFRNYAQSQSLYDYTMIALVHVDAESCARHALEPLGYEILLRDV